MKLFIYKICLALAMSGGFISGFIASAEDSPVVSAENLERIRRAPQVWLRLASSRRYRPTLADVVTVLRLCPECVTELVRTSTFSPLGGSPPVYYNSTSCGTYIDCLRLYGPKIIAFMETHYPNGTYAALGRDAYFFADMLEAFYVGQNVPSPVVRLGASGATVKTGLIDPVLALKFLVSNGLDLDRARSGEKPFVIIDRTSFTDKSQAAQLLRSVFHLDDRGEDSRRLGQFVNAVSTTHGADYDSIPAREAPVRFNELKRNYSNWAPYKPHVPPVLRTPKEAAYLTDVSDLNWHSGFSHEIYAQPNGALSGRAGTMDPRAKRLNVLRAFWEIYQIVNEPKFQAQVWDEARRYGTEKRFIARLQTRGQSVVHSRRLEQQVLGWLRADLEREFPLPSRGPREAEMLREILSARAADWSERLESMFGAGGPTAEDLSGDILAAESAYAIWSTSLAERRAELGPAASAFVRLIAEASFDLKTVDTRDVMGLHHEHPASLQMPVAQAGSVVKISHTAESSSYFSDNALKLRALIAMWRQADAIGDSGAAVATPVSTYPTSIVHTKTKTGQALKVADVVALLRQSEINIANDKFSQRDARRFVLLVLSYLRDTAPDTIRQIGEVVAESPHIRAQLTQYAEMYLTSVRFYRGRAQNVYLALVESGYLPESTLSCAVNLSPPVEGDLLEAAAP